MYDGMIIALITIVTGATLQQAGCGVDKRMGEAGMKAKRNWMAGVGITLTLAGGMAAMQAQAAPFSVDFYTELTRTDTVGSDEYLIRTSMTGSFVFDYSLPYPFPFGRPVLHFKNEYFINGIDSTDSMLLVDPSLAPADWFVGSWEFAANSHGAGFFARFENNDDGGDLFDNPRFRPFVAINQNLLWVEARMSDEPGLDYVDWTFSDHKVARSPIVSWNIAPIPVPEPETYAMMLAGLVLLGFMTRLRNLKAA